MASAVNRSSFQVFLRGVPRDGSGFPSSDWIINPPNLRTLIGRGSPDFPEVPKRYWIIEPQNNLREMTASEKTAADTAPTSLADTRALARELVLNAASQFLENRYSSALREAFLGLRVRASGAPLVRLNAYFDWLTTLYATVQARMVDINNAPTIPTVLAVTFDPAPLIASDPLVRLGQAVP